MRGYLGLGSNVGDRLANLRLARDRLAGAEQGEEIVVVGTSSVYQTEPQGEVTEQPDFLNACLAIETALGPEEVLDRCKAVERSMGREGPETRHGPRTIDVDLLLLGDIRHRSERLTLPHPEVLSRRFVLVPLLELDPRLSLPEGTSLVTALADLEGNRDLERQSGLERQRVEHVGGL